MENEVTSIEQVANVKFEGLVLPNTFKEGKKAIIRGAIKKASSEAVSSSSETATKEEGEVGPGLYNNLTQKGYAFTPTAGLSEQLQGALERALNVKKEVAHVDVAKELNTRGLDAFFTVDSWPPSIAVHDSAVCISLVARVT